MILAFGMFKILSGLGMAREFTVLENNCMQSIATAAGYMTGPMISSLAAYMMVTDTIIPMGTTIVWITSLSLLGVLFAFPLKRRFINDEQHPFPEGRAAGIVMDALHSGDPGEGLLKAKMLSAAAALSALVKLFTSHDLLQRLKLGVLAVPEYLDGWIYRFWSPRLAGTEFREMTVRLDTDIVMFGAGGLMGIRTGMSLMIGAVVNYCILVPWMIQRGDIEGQLVDGVHAVRVPAGHRLGLVGRRGHDDHGFAVRFLRPAADSGQRLPRLVPPPGAGRTQRRAAGHRTADARVCDRHPGDRRDRRGCWPTDSSAWRSGRA